jgi:hypothetical protein
VGVAVLKQAGGIFRVVGVRRYVSIVDGGVDCWLLVLCAC